MYRYLSKPATPVHYCVTLGYLLRHKNSKQCKDVYLYCLNKTLISQREARLPMFLNTKLWSNSMCIAEQEVSTLKRQSLLIISNIPVRGVCDKFQITAALFIPQHSMPPRNHLCGKNQIVSLQVQISKGCD